MGLNKKYIKILLIFIAFLNCNKKGEDSDKGKGKLEKERIKKEKQEKLEKEKLEKEKQKKEKLEKEKQEKLEKEKQKKKKLEKEKQEKLEKEKQKKEKLEKEKQEKAKQLASFSLEEVDNCMEYAAVVYSGEKQREYIKELQNKGHELNFFSTSKEISGAIIERKKDNTIIISYHGAESFANLGSSSIFLYTNPNDIKGRFHMGYYYGFKKTLGIIIDKLKKIAEKQSKNIKELKLIICGHSMGASHAAFLTKYFIEKGIVDPNNIRTCLLGMPKTMDNIAENHYNSLAKNRTINIVQENDNILWLAGNQKIGKIIYVPKLPNSLNHWLQGYIDGFDYKKNKINSLKELQK